MIDNLPRYPRADAVYQTIPEARWCDGCHHHRKATCTAFVDRLLEVKRKGSPCGRNIWKRIA